MTPEEAEEITRLRAEVERLQKEQSTGCCSHGCILKEYGVAPKGGLGTNSAMCYCPEWKWRRVLYKQKSVIEAAFKALDQWCIEMPDEGCEFARALSAKARDLRAELEGK